MELTQDKADAFARIPLTYLRLEYPNHIMHLLNDDGDVLLPRELHPIFYGCFDWHSAVHGYWLLATGYWLLATGYWLLATGCCCAACVFIPTYRARRRSLSFSTNT
ncbi:DUF2891 family protein [Klebsiella variicola]|uniref:DUF2891 family protein n=1 Tax=Klebsiella variicola TaxID=244366 RepID=UPI0022B7BBD1|nr:DUF2891 family protein [Klebsiella variicola]